LGQAPSPQAQLDDALRFSFQPPTGLNAIEIAVDVDLQKDRGMVSRSASIGWNDTFKTQDDT
jgi:hypothetical protein